MRKSPEVLSSVAKKEEAMDRNQIVQPENIVCKKPSLMNDNNMHYCPGCSHGVVHKLIAEVIEEMGMEDKPWAYRPWAAPSSRTTI